MQRVIFSIIFLLTVVAMVTIQNNFLILSLLFLLWTIPYRYYKKTDILFFSFGTISFLIMDLVVVKKGIFSFSRPDFLGLPIYEPFLWGFYLIAIDKIGNSQEKLPSQKMLCLLVILMLLATYLFFKNQYHIFLSQAALLGTTFIFWYKKSDLTYSLIGIVIGAIVEYANVWAGTWAYPEGGVPVWFLTFWAAVGLLDNRLLRTSFSQENRLRR